MELTQEERDILAHVVVVPDAWVTHSLSVAPDGSAVRAKIDRWRPVYLAEKDKSDYKNRVERDVAEEILRQPTEEQLYEVVVVAKEKEILRRQAIAELVAEQTK